MKRNILYTLLLFVFIPTFIFAQSDYEKVEGFKKTSDQLYSAIKEANSLSELSIIGDQIAELKEKYSSEKPLLDKALYPENYESSINKLLKTYETRKGDFTQITQLSEEVVNLKDVITELSAKNEELIVEIKVLNAKSAKDAQTIASLERLVVQLKANIEKRDMLVRSFIDSLLTDYLRSPTTLNEAEKTAVLGKIENRSLFYNIQRVIQDNIDYVKVTQMTTDDFYEMKKEYKSFNKTWNQLGEKLADVYLSSREKVNEVAQIKGLFSQWNEKINSKIWVSVRKLFNEKEITLLPFDTGERFVESVTSFINSEIDNMKLKEASESEKTYDVFTNGVYLKSVQPEWIPLLIENNLMTEANKDSIDTRIARWNEIVNPAPSFTWLYILLAVIIIVQLGLYIRRRQGRQKLIEKKED